MIRQFVAMALGAGYSVEEQITGKADVGGIQLVVYPMKADRYRQLFEVRGFAEEGVSFQCASQSAALSLAPGGRMRQRVVDDPYGLDAWDQRHASRCFITILNAQQWLNVAGSQPPCTPPMAKDYSDAGLPWFDLYGSDAQAIPGSATLASVKSVAGLYALDSRDLNHRVREREPGIEPDAVSDDRGREAVALE